MSGKRLGIASVAVALVLAFALGIYGISSSSRTFRTGYVAARIIRLGAPLTIDDVHQVRITAGDPINSVSSNPVGKRASHQMATGHLLDDSDFLQDSGVEVPVTIKNVTDLHANDRVDIGTVVGGKLVLIGRGITMLTPSLAQVPAQDEIYWLEVNASAVTLYAARSGGNGPPVSFAGGVSSTDALGALANEAAGSGAGAAPSPKPTP